MQFWCAGVVFAAKYDVAISTACHGLDYIVVETSGAAQACVELLRRENLGVATFMILVSHFLFWQHTEFCSSKRLLVSFLFAT